MRGLEQQQSQEVQEEVEVFPFCSLCLSALLCTGSISISHWCEEAAAAACRPALRGFTPRHERVSSQLEAGTLMILVYNIAKAPDQRVTSTLVLPNV